MIKEPLRPFFVGYGKRIPVGLRGFLFVAAMAFLGILLGLGFVLGTAQSDPGGGGFAGRADLTGYLEAAPYPLLRLPPSDTHPQGQAILLSGQGKRGVMPAAASLDGQIISVGGAFLKRGDIYMVQVAGRSPLRPAEEPTPEERAYTPPEPRSIGRWRLTGEICDGKCYLGIMRPGTGLAHKACANLCIQGGVPPVFVSNSSIDGHTFFLLADHNGNSLPEAMYDHVALLIEAEGEVELIDDIARFKIDLNTVQRH